MSRRSVEQCVGMMVVLCLGMGCVPESHEMERMSPPIGSIANERIAPTGGTVALDGFELVVPAGALSAATDITVTVSNTLAPPAFTGFSPVYEFGPAGTVFDAPVTVRIPFDGDSETATVFWTAAGSDRYVALPTEVIDGYAEVQATHFSSAFVGTACEGADCCGRANGELDVLLMVDNSNSMVEEQASLVEQLPRMAEILATGDLDGDGVQDFPAVSSLRVGTVSTDMGTAGFTVPTCARSDFGDDGILNQSGRTDIPGCDATYAGYAEFSSDAPDGLASFVNQVGCVAPLGTSGCGFEQPLESVLKALTPSTMATGFFRGTTGQGDAANAGFLRPESVLATILLTDENDCSAADGDIFNPSSATYTDDLNLRCFLNPEALHPVDRYAEGLLALRSDPNDVVFAAIAGIPTDMTGEDASAILADPRVEERINPSMPTSLEPSCNVPGRGVAFPPTRILQVAESLGDQAVVGSICQEDFTPVMDAILQRVAARVSGTCL
ncbi:MAG: hypothetical protein AB8I08_17070 [Sandaracinaceae bacterium]